MVLKFPALIFLADLTYVKAAIVKLFDIYVEEDSAYFLLYLHLS